MRERQSRVLRVEHMLSIDGRDAQHGEKATKLLDCCMDILLGESVGTQFESLSCMDDQVVVPRTVCSVILAMCMCIDPRSNYVHRCAPFQNSGRAESELEQMHVLIQNQLQGKPFELSRRVSDMYEEDIWSNVFFEPATAWKCTIRRPWAQDSMCERDTLGTQQHALCSISWYLLR